MTLVRISSSSSMERTITVVITLTFLCCFYCVQRGDALADGCPDDPVSCAMDLNCSYGLQEDSSGCSRCACYNPCQDINCGEEECQVRFATCVTNPCRPIGACVTKVKVEVPTIACPMVDCMRDCQYGFQVDSNNCTTCQCVDPCVGIKCPNNYTCTVSPTRCSEAGTCNNTAIASCTDEETTDTTSSNVNGQLSSEDLLDCCQNGGVLTSCQSMCVSNFTLTSANVADVRRCAGDVGVFMACAANGRSFVNCCSRNDVNGPCLDFCSGQPFTIDASNFEMYSLCLEASYLNIALSCFQTGIPDSVPATLTTTSTTTTISITSETTTTATLTPAMTSTTTSTKTTTTSTPSTKSTTISAPKSSTTSILTTTTSSATSTTSTSVSTTTTTPSTTSTVTPAHDIPHPDCAQVMCNMGCSIVSDSTTGCPVCYCTTTTSTQSYPSPSGTTTTYNTTTTTIHNPTTATTIHNPTTTGTTIIYNPTTTTTIHNATTIHSNNITSSSSTTLTTLAVHITSPSSTPATSSYVTASSGIEDAHGPCIMQLNAEREIYADRPYMVPLLNCDSKGFYKPIQCTIAGICQCTTKYGVTLLQGLTLAQAIDTCYPQDKITGVIRISADIKMIKTGDGAIFKLVVCQQFADFLGISDSDILISNYTTGSIITSFVAATASSFKMNSMQQQLSLLQLTQLLSTTYNGIAYKSTLLGFTRGDAIAESTTAMAAASEDNTSFIIMATLIPLLSTVVILLIVVVNIFACKMYRARSVQRELLPTSSRSSSVQFDTMPTRTCPAYQNGFANALYETTTCEIKGQEISKLTLFNKGAEADK